MKPPAQPTEPRVTERPLALYVHIPFCERKCLYCDFNSGVHGPEVREQYVEALLAEIRATPFGGLASSVFFGGGTPSVLPASAIASIVSALRERFAFSDDAEITVECNPGTVASERMAGETTESFLHGLRAAGINRLSFGVQSFDAGLLKHLGRIHSPGQAEDSVRAAQRAGFSNINVDLMFALPGQTAALWADTLERTLCLEVPHVSCYSLIVEPETPFHVWDAEGRLSRPDNDEEADMYETCIDTLTWADYEHYEVSAFAHPGLHCRHNQVYWRNEEYVGFGNGATSYVDGERFSRASELAGYLQKALSGADTVCDRETLTIDGQAAETMMMGLRLLDGVDRAAFRRRFGRDPGDVWPEPIDRLTKLGLLELTPSRIRLTRRGLFVANDVWESFLAG